MSVLALTGGTGFVGSHAITLALARGHQVRALTRRPQPPRAGVTWIEGALDTHAALDRLVTGADAVVHIAGVVNAPDRAGFAAGNVAGTQAMIHAATRAGVRRFVHVSSIAGREPALSNYGWSKAESERVLAASELDWVVVRPPAIYGPGDMEMRDLFRMASRGIALLPPGGRTSVIAADDIADLLIVLATHSTPRLVIEPDDGRPNGWSHAEMVRAMGVAAGRRTVTPIALPKAILTLAAKLDGAFRGKEAKLTLDRVGYLSHPDWVADPAKRPDPTVWRPKVDTPTGFAETVAWYRANGLL